MNNEYNLIEGVALIGFRFFGKEELYTLETYGRSNNDDLVVSLDNKIVFFPSINLAKKAFYYYPKEITERQSIPNEIEIFCDIPLAVKKIKSGKIDQTLAILNCLNMFYDMLDVMKIGIPLNYKEQLFHFQQHLSTDKDIHKFFNESKITRLEMFEAFSWCVGIILSNCKILT